jgi:hypothetical protein
LITDYVLTNAMGVAIHYAVVGLGLIDREPTPAEVLADSANGTATPAPYSLVAIRLILRRDGVHVDYGSALMRGIHSVLCLLDLVRFRVREIRNPGTTRSRQTAPCSRSSVTSSAVRPRIDLKT